MRFTAGVTMIQFFMLFNVPASASDACDGSFLIASMPTELQVLSGMCLLVPCTFDAVPPHILDVSEAIHGIWLKSTQHFGEHEESIIFNSTKNSKYPNIEMVGNVTQKNCTTLFHNLTTEWTDKYYFRAENIPRFKATDTCNILTISVNESVPAPSIQTEGMLAEDRKVSFTCQAPNPCPSLPPQLSWNISELHGVGGELDERRTNASLQGNVTLSYRHDGVRLTCRTTYPPEAPGGPPRAAEDSVTLSVSYSPKETQAGPGSVVVETGQRVNLTCRSRANPPVEKLTWFRRTANGSKIVYEGPLYSFNKSDSDETLYCMATNPFGYQNSTDVKITSYSKDSGLLTVPLLVGGLFGILFFLMICVLCLWKKRSNRQQPQGSATKLEEEIHYGEIDFTKRGAAHARSPARPPGGEVASVYAEVTLAEARNTEPERHPHSKPV